MLASIRDILVISTPRDLPQFESLLGNGTHSASAGSASRYEFAVAIQELALESRLLDVTDAIVPIETSEYG